jgi:hypothetical protein
LEQSLPGPTAPLVAAGILVDHGDLVHATLDIRPYASDEGEFWVASDLTPLTSTRSPRRSGPTTCSASRPPLPPWLS